MPDASGGILWQLGLDAKLLIPGFAGGIVNALMLRSSDPITIIGSIVAGLFAANYFGSTVAYYIEGIVRPPQAALGASAFLCGLCAMALVRGASDALVKSFRSRLGINGNGPKSV